MRALVPFALGFGAALWLAAPAHADVTMIEASAASVIPVGNWRDHTSVGWGGRVSLDVPLSTVNTVRGSLGLVYHPSREVTLPAIGTLATSLWEVPVLLGGRRDLGTSRQLRPYVEAQFGAVFSRTRVAAAGMADVDTDVDLGGLIAVGISGQRFDVGVALWMPSLADLDDAMGLFIAVGFRLAAISSLP